MCCQLDARWTREVLGDERFALGAWHETVRQLKWWFEVSRVEHATTCDFSSWLV